jgi:hypothetical protein
MAALFGAPAVAPSPIFAAPAVPAPAAPAPAGGALAGLFGALGTPAPAPTAPVAAPNPALSTLTVNGVLLGTAPATTPVVAPAAPPAAPAPAPAVVAAAPATGVVPPDAPASDPTLTLEDVKAIEAGTKKRKTKKADAAEAASDDAMVAVLTRIAVALEALVSKGS